MSVRILDLREYASPEALAGPLLEQAAGAPAPPVAIVHPESVQAELGFVYVRGADDLDVARVFAISERFFRDETDEHKAACAITTRNTGWAALRQESLDPSRPGDAKELFK